MFEIRYYIPIIKFFGDAETAGILYVLHIIAQETPNNSFVIGYKDINKLVPWLSVSRIAKIIRRLESCNWLISKKAWELVSGVGFSDQTKGYKIHYEKIFQDTSVNFLLDTRNKPAGPIKTWIEAYCTRIVEINDSLT